MDLCLNGNFRYVEDNEIKEWVYLYEEKISRYYIGRSCSIGFVWCRKFIYLNGSKSGV